MENLLKLQLISGAILLIGIGSVFRLIRKRKIELKYALPWLAVLFLAFLTDCFPGLLSAIAELLGIATPVNALFLLALLFAVCLIFVLTVIVSRQSERIKRIAQASALLEERVGVLEARIDAQKSPDVPETWPNGQKPSDAPETWPNGQKLSDAPEPRADGQKSSDAPEPRSNGQKLSDAPEPRADGQKPSDAQRHGDAEGTE